MQPRPVLGRAVAVGVVLLTGCHVDRAARPVLDVQQTQATDPVIISWSPPDAEQVLITSVRTGDARWLLVAPEGRSIRPPLRFFQGAPPPDGIRELAPARDVEFGGQIEITVVRRDSLGRQHRASVRHTMETNVVMPSGPGP